MLSYDVLLTSLLLFHQPSFSWLTASQIFLQPTFLAFSAYPSAKLDNKNLIRASQTSVGFYQKNLSQICNLLINNLSERNYA